MFNPQMRLVVQTVDKCTVMKDNTMVTRIGKGLVFYIGIDKQDSESTISKTVNWIIEFCKKYSRNSSITNKVSFISNNSTIDNNLNNEDTLPNILLLSQFTLFATYKKKNPSFHNAMGNETAFEIFKDMIKIIKHKLSSYNVQSGLFGEELEIIYGSSNLRTLYHELV